MNSTNPYAYRNYAPNYKNSTYAYRNYDPNYRYRPNATTPAPTSNKKKYLNEDPPMGNLATYPSVYQGCDLARSMINNRLNKLQSEKELMQQLGPSMSPYQQNMCNLYSYRNLTQSRANLANPGLYSYQNLNPIYYPLEMPVNGTPLGMPRVEMGGPVENQGELGGGLGVSEVLLLLKSLGKLKNTTIINVENKEQKVIEEKPKTPPKKPEKHGQGIRETVTVPKSAKKPTKEIEARPEKKDWWRLCRNFVRIYSFMSVSEKYGDFSRIRNLNISKRTKEFAQDIEFLKDWMLAILEPFIDDFKIFEDNNVAFQNNDPVNKIQRQSQNIIVMIKRFLENLIAKTSKISNIPDKIQKILYKYVKDRGYFPKKYLSKFQINRLNFDLYGRTKELNDSQVGMLLAYLLINGITVQQILIHLNEFVEFKDFPHILVSAKYIGSIMHYLTRDTFSNDPIPLKEILALLNYYRNYHIYNQQIEDYKDIFSVNINIKDEDEYVQYLIPEDKINSFWNYCGPFVETYKNFVYAWACKLAKLIRIKFKGGDKDLAPPVRYQVPSNKVYEEPAEQSEEEDEKEEEGN
ncbi:MAG: hypothetical protein MJ252_04245 [archaeon]|nr:hypothetical protein [archaeon]